MSDLALKLREEGNEAFKSKNFLLAAEKYTDGIDIAPKDHILYSNRSCAYASLKEYNKALSDAATCTRLCPGFFKGWLRLGNAEFGLGNYSAASAAFHRALELNPSDSSALQGLSTAREKIKLPATEPARPSESSRMPPSTTASPMSQASVKRKLDSVRSDSATRLDLIAELYASGPMKVKNELIRRLNEFPSTKQSEIVDPQTLAEDLAPLSKPAPFAFLCMRCDKAKISTLLATWRKEQWLCHACYDHLSRCVVPYRDLPVHLRPEKCIHQVPRGYQKKFR